jgi:hypothetical protein
MCGKNGKDDIIALCFEMGFKQREIVAVLKSQFDLNISERHLKRILCKLNLWRSGHSDVIDVAEFVSKQLDTSGQQHGYRLMLYLAYL